MRSIKGPQTLPFHHIDQGGREIASDVMAAARRIALRAIAQAEKVLNDPALALTLFEEIAATVTATIRSKVAGAGPAIEDLDRYFYKAFMRRVRAEARKTPTLHNAGASKLELAPTTDASEIERKVLAHELLANYDTVTVDIILRRYGEQGWREIGDACGISATAARLRFRKAIHQIRSRFTDFEDDSS